MSEAELLKRIDAHMARIDAHLERIDAHLARNSELMEEIREEIRLTREAAARHAEMYDRLAAEADRRADAFVDTGRMLEATRAFTTSLMGRFDRWMRDLTRDMHERREENRSHTQALLAILDRLEPGGATG